jgi:hypothetical protein
MPKKPSEKVITYRFELQDTERRILEQAVTAYSIRNVSKGVYNLTSDVTTVVLLLILYEYVTGKTIIDDVLLAAIGAGGDIAGGLLQQWKDYRQTEQYRQEYNERATSVTGGFHNIWDQIWGALTGASLENINFMGQDPE